MTSINTNVSAILARNAMSLNERVMTTSMERLSTGNRINSAKDDAAGLAIASRMGANLSGMSMAMRNANDGISLAQTAEGAMGQVSDMLQRMRDLSVQSANGTLTDGDRTNLQTEFSQLVAEINNVADTTNFNGIMLLDGSSSSLSLQTGVTEGASVDLELSASNSSDLGLGGNAVEGRLTSGRVNIITQSAVSDILINGQNSVTALVTAGSTATQLKDAINLNSGAHRTVATAFNTLKGAAPTQSTFVAGAIQINGNDIRAAGSVVELVSNINRDAGGVYATLGSDGTIELSNDTGADIIIATSTATQAGFTVGTYQGFIALNSLDGDAITVQAKSTYNGFSTNTGTNAMVKGFGFNETADGKSFTGSMVTAASITDDDVIQINGVTLGESSDSSASAKAASINAIAEESGVTATAKTVAVLTYSMSDYTKGGALTINGVLASVSSATTVALMITAINTANTGAVASLDESGRLLLSNDTGADISVRDTGSFITAITDDTGAASLTTGTISSATSAAVIKGRITMTSDAGTDIRVESLALDGATSSVAANTLMGFTAQSATGTLVGGALSILTQDLAEAAITKLDTALDEVSTNRAKLGAFQNRLTAAVDNLTNQSANLSTSKGRIMDTDYAQATTELARSQIIAQASTAMLAQANQVKQTVLSLLQ